VRRDRIAELEPPFLDVHAAQWVGEHEIAIRADARRFESWEHSVANRLGLGAAVDYALAIGIDAIATRVTDLAGNLRAMLASIPKLTLHDLGVEQCGIVTFTIDGVDPYALAARLRALRINISVSTIDFARFDFAARDLTAVARASVHYYNTADELARFVDAVTAACDAA
jgi:selenocysteine lyase/cysteine desulfurase